MSANYKRTNASIKVTRVFNYNSVCIDLTYDYTGSSPKGFSDKELDNLIKNTMDIADNALEHLKTKVNIPASVRNINK